ncbi:unnamed protein product [Ilex paraguariensis]|uniref:Uncharacterized protein n=1 Tax=Ilex paraguariensis TaxID=185542 RepID=A0ABC8TPP5_9AQUA
MPEAEKAVENQGYDGIIKLCGVGLQQAAQGHSEEKREPVLHKSTSQPSTRVSITKEKPSFHR